VAVHRITNGLDLPLAGAPEQTIHAGPEISQVAVVGDDTPGLRARLAVAEGDTVQRGQLLYENHCMVCHTSVVHVREQRKASSREEIQAWIRRWQKELALNWEPGEIDDVAEFLNQRYYQLEKDS